MCSPADGDTMTTGPSQTPTQRSRPAGTPAAAKPSRSSGCSRRLRHDEPTHTAMAAALPLAHAVGPPLGPSVRAPSSARRPGAGVLATVSRQGGPDLLAEGIGGGSPALGKVLHDVQPAPADDGVVEPRA